VEVVYLIFPVFAAIVTGYVFARLGILAESVSAALIQFVYYVAIPALLFLIIAQQEIESLLNWPFIVAFGSAVVVVSLLIFLGAVYWRRADIGSATIVAMICVQSNTGIIGLPLLHSMFGQKAAVLAALANIIVVVLLLVQILLLEAVKPKDPEKKASTLVPIRNAVLNPLVLSTILGVAYAATPFGLPKLATDYLDLMGSALGPCALFAIGMSIKPASVIRSGTAILSTSSVKLVGLPIVVLAIALAMGLDSLLTIAAVISAALPTAKNEFILAEQYHKQEELAAETVSVTTALSVVTLVVWLLFLSRVYPGAFSLQ
jgi:hypothetical protein